MRLLESAGLGLPEYYKWRSRSGCYFCFFQQKIEWVGLLENHPDLFEQAKLYEKLSADVPNRYTWSESESLEELSKPERIAKIEVDHAKRVETERTRLPNKTLFELLSDDVDDFSENRPCLICEL
jgi:hypothetical protein